eukprot:superscaffoldBa00003100_g16118
MFLDSVPHPSEQTSVLQSLRSPTCTEEKQDQTMTPCLTCLPALLPLAASVPCAGALLYAPVSSLDGAQTFQQALQQSDVQTLGLAPGSEAPAAATPAASRANR